MTGEQVSRAAVLAYRALAHDLEHPAATPAECGVLEVGVQDTPPGSTAGQALNVRLAPHGEQNPTHSRGLALVHSLRAAMHVHRTRDLGLLTAALRPDAAAEGAAVDQVAAAMAEVMGGTETRTKGELSTQITPLVPPRLRSWCPTCQVEHVPDGLFRMATLPAGLRLRPAGNRSAIFFRAAAPDPGGPEPARRELLRRFLRRCGPAVTTDLAAWAGITPPAAKRWWNLLAGAADGHLEGGAAAAALRPAGRGGTPPAAAARSRATQAGMAGGRQPRPGAGRRRARRDVAPPREGDHGGTLQAVVHRPAAGDPDRDDRHDAGG